MANATNMLKKLEAASSSDGIDLQLLDDITKSGDNECSEESKLEQAAKRESDVATMLITANQLAETLQNNPIMISAETLFPGWRNLPDRAGTLQAKVAKFERDASALLNVVWLNEHNCAMTSMLKRHELFEKPSLAKFRYVLEGIRDFSMPEKKKEDTTEKK